MPKTPNISLRLLKMIKRFPELYNSEHDLANDKAHSMVVWDTISYELDAPGTHIPTVNRNWINYLGSETDLNVSHNFSKYFEKEMATAAILAQEKMQEFEDRVEPSYGRRFSPDELDVSMKQKYCGVKNNNRHYFPKLYLLLTVRMVRVALIPVSTVSKYIRVHRSLCNSIV